MVKGNDAYKKNLPVTKEFNTSVLALISGCITRGCNPPRLQCVDSPFSFPFETEDCESYKSPETKLSYTNILFSVALDYKLGISKVSDLEFRLSSEYYNNISSDSSLSDNVLLTPYLYSFRFFSSDYFIINPSLIYNHKLNQNLFLTLKTEYKHMENSHIISKSFNVAAGIKF